MLRLFVLKGSKRLSTKEIRKLKINLKEILV